MNSLIGENGSFYKCLGCEASWTISNENISKIVSHFSPKWGNNFIDETHTSRKHIGKLYDQRQVVLKWSHTPKDAVSTKSTNITLLSVIRCRKCRLYFPASFDKKSENSLSMNLLIQHSKECHKKIVNEWNHHQSLSIKSLR